MAEQSNNPSVQFGAYFAPAETYATNDDSQQAASSYGDDTLANLMESMEQFVAEESPVNHDANDGATDQKHETRGSRRSQRTNATDDVADTLPPSPGPSIAIPAKRAQRKQANSQAAKKAKKDIWTAESVLQNPTSPLVNANLKVCNAS
jgi:hypothetical protein